MVPRYCVELSMAMNAPDLTGVEPLVSQTIMSTLSMLSSATYRSSGRSMSSLVRMLLWERRRVSARRHAISSATIEIAISLTVSAPMSRPMGVWMASSLARSKPSLSSRFSRPVVRRFEPIMPRYFGIVPPRISRRQSAS